MSDIALQNRLRRLVIVVAAVIFLVIIAVSLALALGTPIVLPQAATTAAGQQPPGPYVLDEVIVNGTFTYTVTTTVTPSIVTVTYPMVEVLVVVNGTMTYTTTTTYTTTATSWS